MKTTKTNVPDSEIVRARENQAAGSDDAKLVADRETKATTVAGNGGGTVTTPQPRAASAAAAPARSGKPPPHRINRHSNVKSPCAAPTLRPVASSTTC